MTTPRSIHAALLSSLALALSCCVTVSESNPTPPLIKPQGAQAGTPTKINISPLTRVGIDTSGDAAVFLHLDFRDSADKSIKAFGQLRVQLFQTAAPSKADANPATPARSWDADLSDPVRNALSYDEMITRTYTINLGGVPEWLVHWARHESDTTAPSLVVQFIPINSSSDQPLKATYTLTR